MRLMPPPEATAPAESLKARLLRALHAQRWRALWIAGSAAFGLLCQRLPEGPLRKACAELAALADRVAGVML